MIRFLVFRHGFITPKYFITSKFTEPFAFLYTIFTRVMFGDETVVRSYIVPALCEHISVFQLAENVPVKEGGDAVLYCNFGEQS